MAHTSRLERIVVFVEHFPPYLGSDRTIYELCTRVARRDVRVHFIASQPLRYLLRKRPRRWRYKLNWVHPPTPPHHNITVTYLFADSFLKWLWGRFVPLAYVLTVARFLVASIYELVRFGPDLVISAHASPIVGALSFVSSRLLRKRLLVGCPDWMSEYAAELDAEKRHSLAMKLFRIGEKRLYRSCDAVFTVTNYLGRMLVRSGVSPERVYVIPNGVDPDMFSPAVDCSDIRHKYRLDNTHVVLFSGHIEEWAGIGVLHDLVKGLERVPGRWVLLLVGTGSGVAPLLEKVHDDGLSHLLVAAGLQPFELMPKFNAVADISLCIFPDTLAGNAASPLKLFEYMASGCAVVATRVAGVAEVIDSETGCLVDPNDVEGLVENVIRLCSNTEERQRLARNARSLIESRYSWGHLADEFLSVCHRVFEDPHPAAQDRAIVA